MRITVVPCWWPATPRGPAVHYVILGGGRSLSVMLAGGMGRGFEAWTVPVLR
ncbi:MAG: hypothetical protein AVDCRST_MAG15-244 [uncultured Rubellimicrobium sp.]|uniref:Uncharacterized protein n=1 Tax=uncultured Rubellimicrobium sp. TaxID=543078 RepID=A0A6J4NDP3_9RHOB|nr:MAG: hypothetical protein AVDCRST_MAG15-244 [uncultured Rubellimicrobium sp.]